MPAGALFTNTSYLDGPLDERYPFGVVAVRVVTGDSEDPIARRNLAVAARLIERGRLLAAIGSVAYRPGEQGGPAEAFRSAVGDAPSWVVAMIELDTGPAPLVGDRSAELGELHLRLAGLLDNDARRVIASGSAASFARHWPRRPAGMATVVAAYGDPAPTDPLAWQYTNGFAGVKGLPSSTVPFGRCPHVLAPQLTAAQLAARLGTLAPIAADPLEDIVAMYGSRAAFEAMLDHKLGIDPSNADGSGRTSVNGLLAFWLTRAMITLRRGTKNLAFQAPPELVDGVGLQGADPHAISAAVAEALAPLRADVERLQKTIDDALGAVRR